MLIRMLEFLGMDIRQRSTLLADGVEAYKRDTLNSVQQRATNVGVAAGLGIVALVMVILTFVIGLIALYGWVAMYYGPFAGLGAAAGLTLLIALVSVLIAKSKASAKAPDHPGLGERLSSAWQAGVPKMTVAMPSTTASFRSEKLGAMADSGASRMNAAPSLGSLISDGDIHRGLTSVLGSVLADPPKTGLGIDQPLLQLSNNAAPRSEQAVHAAAEMIRTGSKTTMFGVLAATAFIGYLVARKQQI